MATPELLFKALSDGTRQRLLQVLSRQELSVTELVEVLGQPQSTLSRHLKLLREAGLVVDRRSGPTVLHSTWPVNPSSQAWGEGEAAWGDAAAANGRQGGNGLAMTAALRDGLLNWVRQQALVPELGERLERVILSRAREAADFFESTGARWDQLRIEAFGEFFHYEALTWLLPVEWTVGDLGTGTGYLLPALSGRFRRVVAVDPSETMLAVARHRPELRSARNVEFRGGSLEALPIKDGELDLAIASLVLHHVPRPEAALMEVRRSLRPGGRLVLIEQEMHQAGDFHERMGDYWWGFEPDRLGQWVIQAGFEGVRIEPVASGRPAGRRVGECPRLFVVMGIATGG